MTQVHKQYKDFTPRVGLYKITHLPTGRVFLGASPHVQGMLNRIRFQLQFGSHTNKAMQQDWNQTGADSFSFEVLDELKMQHPDDDSTEDLKELLALWKDKLNLPASQLY